jgi:hypothetical protein
MYPRLANCTTGIVAAMLRTITILNVFQIHLATARMDRKITAMMKRK